MKKLAIALGVAGVLALAVGFSRSGAFTEARRDAGNPLQIEVGEKNPWSNLKINDDADQFSFAIVSDRTGGHRANVFSKAVYQINLMQPAFVMSVGDLIEGYSLKDDVVTEQWNQFDGYVSKFEMPFFYVPGNHDLTNKSQVAKWGERYGKRYYHFVYKNALFVCLCSENPPDGMGTIDIEQRQWLQNVLAANPDVRWTYVFLHKPIWAAKDLEKNGWAAVEKMLAGRKHNAFCGHVHRYQTFQRNGTTYYQLATTGGGSKLRGIAYGEFDMYMWVTMKKDAPILAVAPLDGLLPADLKLPDTDEPGATRKKVLTYPLLGTVEMDGMPLPKAIVTFHQFNKATEKWTYSCDGLTDDTGRFQLSTYGKFDGCPAGDFAVTVVQTGKGYSRGEALEKSLIPEQYATPETSPLKATVKEGSNDVKFELKSK